MDKAGASNIARAVGPVYLDTTTMSNQPSMFFPGYGGLFTEGFSNAFTTNNLSIYIVSLLSNNTSNNDGRLVSFTNTAEGINFGTDANTSSNFTLARSNIGSNIAVVNNSQFFYDSNSLYYGTPYNTPFIFNAHYTGSTLHAYENGVYLGSFSTNNVFNFNKLGFGEDANAKTFPATAFAGNISEMLLFSSIITFSQQADVESYLMWKYGFKGYYSNNAASPWKYSPPQTTFISSITNVVSSVSVYLVNTVSASKTLILPAASSYAGKILYIKDSYGSASNNPINISTIGVDSFENTGSTKSVFLKANYGAVTLIASGFSNWLIASGYSNTVLPTQSNSPYIPAVQPTVFNSGLGVRYWNLSTVSTPTPGPDVSWGVPVSTQALYTTSIGNGTISSLFIAPRPYYYGVSAEGFFTVSTADRIIFRTLSDDGVILNLNNSTLISNWNGHASTFNSSASLIITPGTYSISMYHFQLTDRAIFEMYYNLSSVSQTAYLSNLSSFFTFPSTLLGSNTYVDPFANYDNYLYTTFWATNAGKTPDCNGPLFSGAVTTGLYWSTIIQAPKAIDPIYFGVNHGDVASNYVNGVRNYSCLTSGFVYSPFPTTIVFNALFDNGLVIQFNNQYVLSNWTQGSLCNVTTATLTLSQGFNPIRCVWFDAGGGAQFDLTYNIGGKGFSSNGLGVLYHLKTAAY